jgi:hypothetical protein
MIFEFSKVPIPIFKSLASIYLLTEHAQKQSQEQNISHVQLFSKSILYKDSTIFSERLWRFIELNPLNLFMNRLLNN